MRFYVDSADVQVIEALMETGAFHGVTTNPLILRQAGIQIARLADFAAAAFGLGAMEIFFQSWGEDAAELLENGLRLSGIDGRVVVKLPATREGFEAAAKLARNGAKTCITAVYAPYQALLAASVGAAYAAPYLGRMNDAGRDGQAMIARMSEALRNTNGATEILAASIRSPEDVTRLAGSGVRCVTLSPAVARMLFDEPLTIEAAAAFEAAARELL